mmetsp:Transcript_34297/g.82616  ORF Transcript_34297/g.82616 Transcript_34297/m.82616 type:complete len:1136 (-) Transcript_34297:436-3843(-)
MAAANEHLERILSRLRPFQREAYEFAVHGTASDRQWSESSQSSPSTTTTTRPTTTKTATSQVPAAKSGRTALGLQQENHDDLLGKGRILLCDEMGLGKTITSLAIMTHYIDEWPLLILCPASLRYTWPSEIEKFLPGIPSTSVYVMQGFDDADVYENPLKRKKVKIVVATYSLLQNRAAAARCLDQFNFKCIIVDESHNLKQKKSQRTALALPLLQKADRLVLLSGTPALARPVELWTQVYAIAPKLFGKYTPFTIRYCDAKRDRFGWNVNGLSHAEELHERLRPIMVRRLKADVLHELPPKVRSIVPVTLPRSSKRTESINVMKELHDTRQSVADLVGEEANSAHFEARGLLMQAYQTCGIAKADAVCDYCLDWLKGTNQQQKVLIFAHHAAVLDAVEKAVSKELKGVGHIRIDGTVSSNDRAIRVKKFQTSSQVRVAILSMTAAGVGLTLTAASSVIFAELHWTPGVLAQCEDRAHRIGQPDSVNVVYLICEDSNMSIDNQLWKMLSRKISSLGKVIDGQRGASLQANYQEKDNLKNNNPNAGMSVQDELSTFFADASTSKNDIMKKDPPKGSILNFFAKKGTSDNDSDGKNVLSAANTPSSKHNSSEHVVEWSCSACTFNNARKTRHTSSLACSICGKLYCVGDAEHQHEVRKVTPAFARTSSLKKTDNHSEVSSARLKRPNKPEMVAIDDDCSGSSANQSSPKTPSVISQEIIILDDDDDDDDGDNGDVTFTRNALSSSKKKQRIDRSSTKDAMLTSNNSRKKPAPPSSSAVLSFAVSKNSGRIMIHYVASHEPSLVNFDANDILTKECSDALMEAKFNRLASNHSFALEFDDGELKKLVERLDFRRLDLPDHPSDLHNRLASEVREFVREYMNLREVEKRWLQEGGVPHSGSNLKQNVILRMPNMTDHSTSRYTGGALERARENVNNGIATDRDWDIVDGYLCAYCGETMPEAARHQDVLSTYCSAECTQQGRLKRGGVYSSSNVRQQVFGLERGVCQLCRIDAHRLYTRILALQPSERLNALLGASWKLPKSATSLERLLHNPKEGDFWQADHIQAVSEGGGGCDLSNLRTLCVPCHKSETERLQGRLKLTGGSGGSGGPSFSSNNLGRSSTSDSKRQSDIRSMFFKKK